jgi:hypothetical protein
MSRIGRDWVGGRRGTGHTRGGNTSYFESDTEEKQTVGQSILSQDRGCVACQALRQKQGQTPCKPSKTGNTKFGRRMSRAGSWTGWRCMLRTIGGPPFWMVVKGQAFPSVDEVQRGGASGHNRGGWRTGRWHVFTRGCRQSRGQSRTHSSSAPSVLTMWVAGHQAPTHWTCEAVLGSVLACSAPLAYYRCQPPTTPPRVYRSAGGWQGLPPTPPGELCSGCSQ